MTEAHDSRPLPSAGELASLHDEIRLYLNAVEAFRREGREPRWLPEVAEKEALR